MRGKQRAARRGPQGREALQEFEGLEEQGGRAIAPRSAELSEELAAGDRRQAERRSRREPAADERRRRERRRPPRTWDALGFVVAAAHSAQR